MGLVGGFFVSQSSYMFNRVKFSFVVWISGRIWFLPMISSQPIGVLPLKGGFLIRNLGDRGWLEFIGGQGVNHYLIRLSIFIQFLRIQGLKFFIFIL